MTAVMEKNVLSDTEEKKNLCIYQVTSTVTELPDHEKAVSYGLLVYTARGVSADGSAEDFCIINNISDDLEKVRDIARTLSENKVCPVHVKDIIYDIL